MTRQNLQQSITITLAIILLTFTIWGVVRLNTNRQLSSYSAQDITSCQQLSDKIQALQSKPQLVASQTRELQEITRIIEQTAQSVSIPKDRLANIWPEPPRRVDDTAYLEKPTRIDLRKVTLKQLVNFLDRLTTKQNTLNVKTLRLSPPPDRDDTKSWNAEMTVTYFIYSPKELTKKIKNQRNTGIIN